MLNIISRSILFKNVSGPKKVVENLIKGLDKLGYPYVVNKRLDACKRLYIHDDRTAFLNIPKIDQNVKIITGPNIFNLPMDIPNNIDISRTVYIQPSEWAKELFLDCDFNKCKLDFWPVGIDTDEFKPLNLKKEFILIYFKIRDKESEEKLLEKELKQIENVLKNKKLDYRIIKYSSYKEEDFKNLLNKSRYIIWLGMLETQGIAFEEALATNIPVLVCDFNSHFTCIKNRQDKYYKVTNAPYFSDASGLKIKNLSELERAINFMENNLSGFNPRKYILKNLSLEKQAKELILLYQKHFGMSYEEGFKERLLKNGDWLNNKFYYRLYLKLKHFTKIILLKCGIWQRIENQRLKLSKNA